MSRSLVRPPAPIDQKLTRLQARRLAALAGVEPATLDGLTLAQARDQLPWIDPILFFWREICGQVVAPGPNGGPDLPVPFATVQVQETECSLLGFFPAEFTWCWHFPLFCHRETIVTVTTDACGRFCVWVPRFEIEWIRTWRFERLCFETIFNRPTIGSLVPLPVPGHPDPGPVERLAALTPAGIGAIAGAEAQTLAERAASRRPARALGAPTREDAALLNRRAFPRDLPPPLPRDFRTARAGQGALVAASGIDPRDALRGAIAEKLGLAPHDARLQSFDPAAWIGPFERCIDILVPEWQLFFEVPDITFLVTQDVDGSGTQQTIYDDPFGVNWNTDSSSTITLVANGLARTTQACQTPEVPCGDVPAILFAGLMPLDNPSYFDSNAPSALDVYAGYALRPNRPATGDGSVTPTQGDPSRPAAQTPFCETVQLYGCVNVPVGGADAAFYRVSQSLDGGTTWSVITGISWDIFKFSDGTPVPIVPDAQGWYAVLPDPDAYHPARLVLDWPTPLLQATTLKVEVADAAKATIIASAPVTIQSDNTVPNVLISLQWKFAGASDSTLQTLTGIACPSIRRGAPPRDVEVVYTATVSSAHLRDAQIWVSGCGGAAFALESASPAYETSHWYTTPGDDTVTLSGRYSLSAAASDGCYGFGWTANSRAMNPSGADGGNLLPTDWNEDVVYLWNDNSLAVSVVSEN